MAYSDEYEVRATDTEPGDVIRGEQVETLYDVLGATPAGSEATVSARLAAIEASVTGKANTSHNHDASAVTSGTFSPARLGSGTPGMDLFLRGDGTWAYPATAQAQGLVMLEDGEPTTGLPIGWLILRPEQV